VKAFVMVNAEFGMEREALRQLKKVEGVKEAYLATGGFGVHNIIAVLEAEHMDKVKDAVSELRQMDKVRSTLTMIVVEKF
jgi:DNA-binding Lrp family transcriptional regulator